MAEVELVTGGRAAARRGTFTRDRLVFGYALLAPAVLYMCLLVGVPFFFSLYLSLSDATVGSQVARFVGFQNFIAIFQDSTFRMALRNTVMFTVIAGICKGLLGTLMAFLLIQEVGGKKFIRSLIVLPWTLPVAISALAWKWMFDPQFSAINYVGVRLGLIHGWPNWIGEPGLAMAAVIAVNVWRGFPFAAIVLMAAFSAVPLELLDAGKVDGATFFHRYPYIVIPVVARTTENMLLLVPNTLREAAIALGTPRSLVIRTVTWRAARAGIVTGMLLAIARISGETAPLLFTALNNQFWSTNPNAPMASLPAVIFQFAMSPYEDWHRLAWAGALLITFAVLSLSILARVLESGRAQQ